MSRSFSSHSLERLDQRVSNVHKKHLNEQPAPVLCQQQRRSAPVVRVLAALDKSLAFQRIDGWHKR